MVAEQHNALLMKNHEARPTGAAPLPEANMVESRDQSEVKRDDHRGYNNARGRGKIKDDTLIVKVVVIIKGRTT